MVTEWHKSFLYSSLKAYKIVLSQESQKRSLDSSSPLISVLIRTCDRPGSLCQALDSLLWQTYKNFEVIIIEDGAATSQKVIRPYCEKLTIKYAFTGKKVGRCEAGNLALKEAKGELCNFLDDDDSFFPWHLEKVVRLAQKAPFAGLYCMGSLEGRCITQNKAGDQWNLRGIRSVFPGKITFEKEAIANRLPIQSVAFRRELYEHWGGFQLFLDAYEDWELWIRYLSHTEARSDDCVTTFYKVEADVIKEAERILRMKTYLPTLKKLLFLYEKDGRNAGELQKKNEESKEEQELDRLRACARDICQTAEKIARCRKYRALKPLRMIRRWVGSYTLPESPQDFTTLFQYQAFLDDWKRFS